MPCSELPNPTNKYFDGRLTCTCSKGCDCTWNQHHMPMSLLFTLGPDSFPLELARESRQKVSPRSVLPATKEGLVRRRLRAQRTCVGPQLGACTQAESLKVPQCACPVAGRMVACSRVHNRRSRRLRACKYSLHVLANHSECSAGLSTRMPPCTHQQSGLVLHKQQQHF